MFNSFPISAPYNLSYQKMTIRIPFAGDPHTASGTRCSPQPPPSWTAACSAPPPASCGADGSAGPQTICSSATVHYRLASWPYRFVKKIRKAPRCTVFVTWQRGKQGGRGRGRCQERTSLLCDSCWGMRNGVQFHARCLNSSLWTSTYQSASSLCHLRHRHERYRLYPRCK